jgi:large subunit ribosomal protein L18
MKLKEKKRLRRNRIWRVRKKVRGSAERPRMCVYFSNKHIFAQVIDDVRCATLVSLSTLEKSMNERGLKADIKSAQMMGQALGKKAVAEGIQTVVFDRNGRLYHGAVKAFAEAARAEGLRF